MTKEELQMAGFEIVAYSGDARSTLLTALKEVRQGNFEHVDAYLKEAEANLTLAHNVQTSILSAEASGTDLELGFIFIHGQDHLMTTLLLKELMFDLITLYQKQG